MTSSALFHSLVRNKTTKRAYHNLENEAKRICTEVGAAIPSFPVSSHATGPNPRIWHQRAGNRAIRAGAGKSFIPPRYKFIKGQSFYKEFMVAETGEEDRLMPIFALDNDLKILASLNRVHLDCTFKSSKGTPYGQMLIVGGKITHYFTNEKTNQTQPKSLWQPLVFALLENKEASTYNEAYRRIRGENT